MSEIELTQAELFLPKPPHSPAFRSDGKLALFYRGPFSQWWYSPFTFDGIEYNCPEQFMMASKAKLFKDEKALEQIMQFVPEGVVEINAEWFKYPKFYQEQGRKVQNYSQDVWDEAKEYVVTSANVAKFSQHQDLKLCLSYTKGLVIAEASPIDLIWGIGFSEDQPQAWKPQEWRGQNLLGKALMEVRDHFLV